MLTVIYVPMYRGRAGDPPDGSGAEGGGGAGGDVRVVLGVQLVIDGVLRAERPGGGSARSQAWPLAQEPLCRAVPRRIGPTGSGFICIYLHSLTFWNNLAVFL